MKNDSNGALTRDGNRGINSITYDYGHHTYSIKMDINNGTPTSWNYYVTDHLGSTRMVVDSNDSIRETINYYPFGSEMQMTNPALLTGGTSHPYRFTGKELDRLTSLNMYDFGARWYDVAGVPMWTSIDPLCEKYYNVSPYAYCSGNPVNRIDTDGRDDYLLTPNGGIVLLRSTDDDFHTLYAQGEDGSLVKENSLIVSKQLFSNKDTKSYKGRRSSDVNLTVSDYNVDFYCSTDEKESVAFFEFAAKKSNVEWSNTRISFSEGGGQNIVATSHTENAELGQRVIIDREYGFDDSNSTIIYANHSHNPSSIGFSFGDIKMAKDAVVKNPNILLQIYNGKTYQMFDQYDIPGVINGITCYGKNKSQKR